MEGFAMLASSASWYYSFKRSVPAYILNGAVQLPVFENRLSVQLDGRVALE